jgi:hypothetical protein
METGKTSFDNQNHGFHFGNRFEFPDVLNVRLSFLKLTDIVYGLCGGMSFAAIDYYKLGLPVPDFDQPEEISVKLFRYLWNRQLDSLRGGTLRKLVRCMLRSDAGLAKAVISEEIPKLRNLIDQGTPAVLALVRVKGLNDPTRNHQVLVTGYDYDPQTRQMTLSLYDPNHPRREPKITFNMANPDRGIQITQSTGEALRGFFLINYNTETPPA